MEQLDDLVVNAVFRVSGWPGRAVVYQRRPGREWAGSRRRVGDYFRPLSKAAEEANRKLARAACPFRFCVYRSAGGVFIDVAGFDQGGRICSIDTREITDADFDRCIEGVANALGLCFDQAV